jgi:hypothetical protein
MSTPANTAPATGAPANNTAPNTSQETQHTEQPPKSPKEIAREKFRQETAELVAKDAKEREQTQRDAKGRFQPQKETQNEAKRESKPEQKADEQQVQKKIWKLKVDGSEVDFDATDEEAVKRAVQKAHAADKRMNEASMTRKQAEKFIELLKTNPRAVLSHPSLGVDLKSLAEQIVWEHMQAQAKDASKSPEDKAREAEKAELEQLRQEKAEREAAKKQAEREELKEKYRQDWSQKFQSELEKAGVPKTDWTLTRMAAYMRQALAKGHKHVQPSDVVDFVREDWQAAQREMFSHLDGDALINMLGEETAEKVRKAQLARFQGGSKPAVTKADAEDKKPGRRFTSVEDMMRETRRK